MKLQSHLRHFNDIYLCRYFFIIKNVFLQNHCLYKLYVPVKLALLESICRISEKQNNLYQSEFLLTWISQHELKCWTEFELYHTSHQTKKSVTRFMYTQIYTSIHKVLNAPTWRVVIEWHASMLHRFNEELYHTSCCNRTITYLNISW